MRERPAPFCVDLPQPEVTVTANISLLQKRESCHLLLRCRSKFENGRNRLPEGTSKKDESGDQASLRKNEGKVSSWNMCWTFCTQKDKDCCETSSQNRRHTTQYQHETKFWAHAEELRAGPSWPIGTDLHCFPINVCCSADFGRFNLRLCYYLSACEHVLNNCYLPFLALLRSWMAWIDTTSTIRTDRC